MATVAPNLEMGAFFFGWCGVNFEVGLKVEWSWRSLPLKTVALEKCRIW